ncbi:MAG TPA: energy-coupling factor transporter transmembrane component T [Clostridiales bacterium]|nr:energy-coupling factor transporter transmembrane component T [Clostridiales bacterium]
MDAGIKLILTLFLAIIPFFCEKDASYVVFFSFFALLSLISGIPGKTLLKNIAAYVVIIILPLLFGVAVQALFALFGSGGTMEVNAYQELFYRILRLFLLWYITSLYIMTTPMELFLGLLNQILLPLRLLKIPVAGFLSTIRFIMLLLAEMAGRFLDSYKELFSSYQNKSRRGFRNLVKDMAQVLVSLISASLADTDKVQEMLVNDAEKGFSYRFRCSFPDFAALLLFCALMVGVYFIEKS